MPKNRKGFRLEADSLGERRVPIGAYWGVQTLRASENFAISGMRAKPVFITATAMVKKAAARTNLSLGLLDRKRAGAIIRAADEIINGGLHDQFIVDVYQAGAGTSHNMNANEVIANRAIEELGGRRGDYSIVHPNDHVNASQSTNDAMPAALRVAAIMSSEGLVRALNGLSRTLRQKAARFDGVIKSGRTHLQDAAPVRLGQEFSGYAASVESSVDRIKTATGRMRIIGLGGTAVGTGINTHPLYRKAVMPALRDATGIRGLRPAPDYFEAATSLGDFTASSGALRGAAADLIRICNDLRLLASGPHTGLAEITIPAVQPGSSIMPGKVNPSMPEMLTMVSFQVIGNDLAITLAAQAGQLELNVMFPLVNWNLLHSIEILTNAVSAFDERCARGIEADRQRCKTYFENSAGLATALNRVIGYEAAARVVKEAEANGETIREAVLRAGIMTKDEWERITDPKTITGPAGLKGLKRKRPGRAR
ncbi:MAG: aspartate ammonia-lyase [Deltaproteobacteria bacterium]|nr:aspartate ammonia-lyase [Deltaproteobacteria bacterium]